MSRSRRYLLAAGALVGSLTMALCWSPAWAATPHITATPTDPMVDTPVSLAGSGFPHSATFTLQECSSKDWVVPANPCLITNRVHVHTNAEGAFNATMTAQICPASTPPFRTRRKCYIGEPVPSGIDTITLVGAAKIVVSWP
jgi:hypothetical protein